MKMHISVMLPFVTAESECRIFHNEKWLKNLNFCRNYFSESKPKKMIIFVGHNVDDDNKKTDVDKLPNLLKFLVFDSAIFFSSKSNEWINVNKRL